MQQPLVSVLMPAFNAAATIGAAVDSILAQSYENWEAVIVDDGSSDGTYELAAGFADARIRVVRQDHAGVSAARNRAARESRGDLLALLDADDLFLPGKLAAQVRLLLTRVDVGSTYSWHYRTDHRGKPWTVHTPAASLDADDLLRGFPINTSTHVVRRHWHEAVDGFREDLSINEDRDYFVRLADAGCQFAGTDGIQGHYRLRGAGGRGEFAHALEQALRVSQSAAARHPAAAAVARLGAFQEYALQAAVIGDATMAQACLAALLQESPRLLQDRNQRDDFLQAIVGLATRTREDPDPVLDRVFGQLTGTFAELQAERRWASGSAHLQCGVRELLWEGGEAAAEAHIAAAGNNGPQLDERSCRLLRYQLSQARRGFGSTVWPRRRGAIHAFLSRVASPGEAARLLDSVDPAESRGVGVWTRFRRALRR